MVIGHILQGYLLDFGNTEVTRQRYDLQLGCNHLEGPAKTNPQNQAAMKATGSLRYTLLRDPRGGSN